MIEIWLFSIDKECVLQFHDILTNLNHAPDRIVVVKKQLYPATEAAVAL